MQNFDINDSNRKSFPNHLVVRSLLLLLSLMLSLSWLQLMFDDLLDLNCHFSAFVRHFGCCSVVAVNRDVLTTNIRTLTYFGWLARRPKMPPRKLTILDMSSYR